MNKLAWPQIRQGGMGVRISGPNLARTVAMLGGAGTVTGVLLERVVARILQQGDPGGHFRRALSHFPFPDVANSVLRSYFIAGGIPNGGTYKGVPVFSVQPSKLLIALTICANFAAVWLAKEGHGNHITINYLEKVAMPHVYAITGAMLASVDYVTMGAGIPLQIPELISSIADGKLASYRIPVVGRNTVPYTMSFNPENFFGGKLPPMKPPGFIPIISSNLLASILTKKLPEGSISGFVVEEWTAGGHNAPPRKLVLGKEGEVLPVYGTKDVVDYGEIAKFGVPFWIGGSKASPDALQWALSVGAAGIQSGSIFALCEESDMDAAIRKRICQLGFAGKLTVSTDMLISPTGFPFKVAHLSGTLSQVEVYAARQRVCNQGALVTLYVTPNGSLGYRCAAEPVDRFVAKGGAAADTAGRGCICNALAVTAGIGDPGEPPVVTLGDDVSFLKKLMATPDSSYSAEAAIKYLLGNTT